MGISNPQNDTDHLLKQAIHDAYGEQINASKLGAYMRSFKDQIENNIKLIKGNEAHGTTLWKVVQIDK